MKTYSDAIPEGHGFPLSARPGINWNHIDGPLLYFRDGQLHWLTLWERLLCALDLADAESIEQKRRPNLMKAVAEHVPSIHTAYRGRRA